MTILNMVYGKTRIIQYVYNQNIGLSTGSGWSASTTFNISVPYKNISFTVKCTGASDPRSCTITFVKDGVTVYSGGLPTRNGGETSDSFVINGGGVLSCTISYESRYSRAGWNGHIDVRSGS